MSLSASDPERRPPGPTVPDPHPQGLASALERNIQALADRRRQEQADAPFSDKLADAISRFAGSLLFVGVHAVLVAGWILVNAGLTPFRPFDPTFVILATVASVEAIFLSTFILISQNRAAAAADRRADLHLQTSLLAEHEITRLIQLTSEIARRLDIPAAGNPELKELERSVAPEVVLERIEESEEDR